MGRLQLLRAVARPVGAVIVGLSAFMAACAAVGVGYRVAGLARPGIDDDASLAMGLCACLTIGVGLLLHRAGRTPPTVTLGRREAALTVTLVWFGASVVGALPFVVDAGLSPVDALFEATSGFTTTGSTVVTNIEGELSRPLLLWRSLTQWLGGMGIVVLFVAVFPSLGVGGKHMFRSEVPGHESEGLQPRVARTALILWSIYAALTGLEVVLLVVLGIDPFEAVCHAFTSLSGGGFSTRDASVAAFDSAAVDVVIATFLLSGGVNFGLYYAAMVRRSARPFRHSTEFRVYFGVVALAVVACTVLILPNHEGDPLEALRFAYFFVATTITSTGYVTDDYMAFVPSALALMILLMLMGGSSGSTAGGMKVSRIVLLAKTAWREIRHSIRPQVVEVVRLGRPAVTDRALLDVAAFFFLYLAVIAAGVVLVCLVEGVPVPTAFGAMVTTIGNNGPAPFYLGADHFAAYSVPSKLWFIATMVLGRLELVTVLAIFHRDMWR